MVEQMEDELHIRLARLELKNANHPLTEVSTVETSPSPYTTLNCARPSFRLVTVLPNLSDEGHLQCHLHECDLNTSVTFQALSYEWGQRGLRTILVHGQPFQVRHNLYDFLVHSRHHRSSQALWIDAICVDQSNTAERNHQVQLMGRIYTEAEQVILWLGNISDAVENLFQNIRQLGAALDPGISEQSQPEDEPRTASRGLWHRLEILCRNNYWYRAWIIQEIGLAKKILLQHEQDSLAWSCFSQYMQQLKPIELRQAAGQDENRYEYRTRLFILQSRAMSFCQWRMVGRQSKMKSEMLHLLERFPNAACMDPRDRVFSMVSIATNGHQLSVDYRMSFERLFLETMLAIQSKEPAKLASRLLAALNLDPRRLLKSDVHDRIALTQAGSDLECPKCHAIFRTAKMQHDSTFLCLITDDGIGSHLQFWNYSGPSYGFKVANVTDTQSESICQRKYISPNKFRPPRDVLMSSRKVKEF